ncbi:MAG TPA: hypothetical protein DHV14_05380 [Micrococcales bacterium]|nr:hypothetical protein [Micrococcales bacterium]
MAEWPTAMLGDLVVDGQISYGVVQPGSQDGAGVPIVRVKDIRDGKVDTRWPARVSAAVSERHARTVLSGGELLVTLVGTVGEAAVAGPSLAGWNVARAVAVVRPKGVSAEWLRIALLTPTVREQIRASVNTTVQTTLNLSDLKTLRVPVPDELTRTGIAEVLGALDDKIAANKRLAAIADDLARAKFDEEAGLGGYRAMPLGDAATIVLGGTPDRANPEYWTDGTVPWLNSGKANEARVFEPSELITETALARSAAKLMPRSATVLAITGATLGKVARLEIEAAGNQSLVGIWSHDPALNDWLFFAVRGAVPKLVQSATGAAQQHVSKRDVEALEVPVAPTDALARWGSSVRPLLDSAAAVGRQNRTLAATRDALLPALMSGALRVKDPKRLAEDLT